MRGARGREALASPPCPTHGTHRTLRLAVRVSCVKMVCVMSDIRSRNWNILLYKDDPTHWSALAQIMDGSYSFCGILHDRDFWIDGESDVHSAGELKKEHYHIVLTFPNARYRSAVANELGIKENYIEACQNRSASIMYLIHDGYPDKVQYDKSEVFGPLKNLLDKLMRENNENARVLALLKLIDDCPGELNLRKLIVLACENELYGDLRRMGSWVKDLIDMHNGCVVNNDYYSSRASPK